MRVCFGSIPPSPKVPFGRAQRHLEGAFAWGVIFRELRDKHGTLHWKIGGGGGGGGKISSHFVWSKCLVIYIDPFGKDMGTSLNISPKHKNQKTSPTFFTYPRAWSLLRVSAFDQDALVCFCNLERRCFQVTTILGMFTFMLRMAFFVVAYVNRKHWDEARRIRAVSGRHTETVSGQA